MGFTGQQGPCASTNEVSGPDGAAPRSSPPAGRRVMAGPYLLGDETGAADSTR